MTALDYLRTLTPRVEVWNQFGPDSEPDFSLPKPCDYCGELTNTPDACFDCYHQPFGIGWEREMMERMGYEPAF